MALEWQKDTKTLTHQRQNFVNCAPPNGSRTPRKAFLERIGSWWCALASIEKVDSIRSKIDNMRAPVSIVCVYNDADVMRSCLERSIELLRHEAPSVEFLPVDNTRGMFTTAGAALNHGAALARHNIIAFTHQDVLFHSLIELERSAGFLVNQHKIGMLGAVGIRADGSIAGRVRDRVVLLGDALDVPTDVDSLDEVIFLVPRAQVLKMPLVDSPELAWHAYAVEYGLRLRANGLRVTACNIPITHNSLTINLDRLDVAHNTVGALYPQMLPLQTTCGVISLPYARTSSMKFLQVHRWRYRWIPNTVASFLGRWQAAGAPFVMRDIRREIDVILANQERLTIVNHSGERAFEDERNGPTELTRFGRRITFRSARTSVLSTVVAAREYNESMLVTNLDIQTLRLLAPMLNMCERVVGFHEQYWVLLGMSVRKVLNQWKSR